MESADRDIFQTFKLREEEPFVSGHKALNIRDNSVDFYREKTQFNKINKKTNKKGTLLDLAENLANSGKTTLAAEILGGSRGIIERSAEKHEIDQVIRILKKLIDSGDDKLPALSPDKAMNKLELIQRTEIQKLLSKISNDKPAKIPNNETTANTTSKRIKPPYDSAALWGKGVLNIKNALLYAEFKMRYPGTSAHELRERMLKFINTQQQYTAMTIQKKLRSRIKATEEQKAEWDKRPALVINTSLPDRPFKKALTDPFENPSPADQSDKERLKELGVTLPEPPTGKGLKKTSNKKTDIDAIPDINTADLPEGTSDLLKNFLKSDKDSLFDNFKIFAKQEFLPLIGIDADKAAEALIKMNLLNPFMANRVINRANSYDSKDLLTYNQNVTIISLFNDFLCDQKYSRDYEKSDPFSHLRPVKNPGMIGISLFNKIKSLGLMNDFIKAEILSLIDNNRPFDLDGKKTNENKTRDFINKNNLLDFSFNTFEVLHQKGYRILSKTGKDILKQCDSYN